MVFTELKLGRILTQSTFEYKYHKMSKIWLSASQTRIRMVPYLPQ